MLLVERIIKAPTVGKGIWLGIVLTLELLPGYPQILFFTYQIVGLRVLWEFVTDRVQRPLQMLAVLAIGLALPMLLGAAYLLPSIEFSRESVRAHPLTFDEIKIPHMKLTWKVFRENVGLRTTGLGTTFAVVPVALAALAFDHAAAPPHGGLLLPRRGTVPGAPLRQPAVQSLPSLTGRPSLS